MTSPLAAAIATTMGVVRLPGRPPTQCLSSTMGAFHFSVSPTSTMARVRDTVSCASSAILLYRQESRQMRRCSALNHIALMAASSSGLRRCPWTRLRMPASDSSTGGCRTTTYRRLSDVQGRQAASDNATWPVASSRCRFGTTGLAPRGRLQRSAPGARCQTFSAADVTVGARGATGWCWACRYMRTARQGRR